MSDLKAILTLGALTLSILLFIPGLRHLIITVADRILWPVIVSITVTAGVWLMWLLRRIGSAHANVFANLTRPHSVIFPSLDARDTPEGPP